MHQIQAVIEHILGTEPSFGFGGGTLVGARRTGKTTFLPNQHPDHPPSF